MRLFRTSRKLEKAEKKIPVRIGQDQVLANEARTTTDVVRLRELAQHKNLSVRLGIMANINAPTDLICEMIFGRDSSK